MVKKTTSIISILIIIAVTSLLLPVPAQAVPQPPHQFNGDVTIGDSPAPDGVTVTAAIGGASFPYPPSAQTSSGRYGDVTPLFKVPADDPDTTTKEGGISGDTVYFYVAGVTAGSYTFEIGGSTEVDLAISALPTLPKPTNVQRTTPETDNTPTFTWNAVTNAKSYEVRIDTDAFSNISNVTTYTLATVADGSHTFEVRAIDLTDQPGASSDLYSFTIDTTPPAVTITALSPDPTSDNTTTLTGTATDVTTTITSVEYRVDGGSWTTANATDGAFDEAIENYTLTTPALADGSHTIEVRATDATGFITAAENYASDTFTIDTIPPTVTITPLSPDPSTDSSPTLTGTATDVTTTIASVEYRIDGGSWTTANASDGAFDGASENYTLTTSRLDDGSHTVEVRATDAANNVTTAGNYASDTFTVSTAAPAPTPGPVGGVGGAGPAAPAPVAPTPTTPTSEDIAAMTPEKAAETLTTLDTEVAAGIIEKVTTATAANIMEKLATEVAADIIEAVTTARAADIIEAVTTAKAADIIAELAVEKAAAIMEKLSTAKLTGIVPAMSEAALMERLPELSTDKLYSIGPAVLFKSLPNAPTEQLVSELPPQPPPGLPAPAVVHTTATSTKYRAAETAAGKWVLVIGSPAPIDKLLIKTKRALTDVGTTVDILEELPAEVAVSLPAEQIVSSYLTIAFENASPEDIELGHLTFKVGKDWLKQNSIHKWSVTLRWYDPERQQWISLPTKRIGEDDSYLYYSIVISHFSIFAISGSEDVAPPTFTITNLVISPATVEISDEVTVNADVTNLSDTAATHAATLWIDGTIAAAKNVLVNAGETKSVSLTATGDVEGSYAVRVDRLFGSFTTTTPVAPLPPPPPEEKREVKVVPEIPLPTKPINWGLIGSIIAAVIAISVLSLLIIRRRRA